MDSHINVVFYSKFSEVCNKFIGILNTIPSLRESTILVCVDNKEVRERIMGEGRYRISIVPCLMQIYDQNDHVETFQGERAFDVLGSYAAQAPPTPSSDGDYLIPINVGNAKVQFPPRSDLPPRQFTSVEEIEKNRGGSEDNVAVTTYTHVPRNTEDPQILLERENQEKMLGNRNSVSNPHVQNLTNKAAQMQKERETALADTARANGGRTPL
jgi:hypothetical protein